MAPPLVDPLQLAAVALWWLGLLAIARLGMPIAARVLPRDDPTLAAGLGLPLGLAIIWLVGFGVGHVALGPAAWLGLGVLVVAAYLAEDGRYGSRLAPPGFRSVAVVFTLGFLLIVGIRALDPGIAPGGGEKFLDFGLLKSLLRTETLPPVDPWFAGEPVSYYYGGHLLSAQLTRLTFTPAGVAYNLALAAFFGSLVATAYGLAAAIGRAADVSGRLAGGFGAFFVGLASNLAPAVWFLSGLAPSVGVPLLEGVGIARGRFDAPTIAYGHQHFSYWHASGELVDGIHEFPLFAWLNGDLHAHMMSTPFLLLAAGLLFAYYRTPAEAGTRRRLLLFGLVPPVAGLLAVTNTWSFPTVGGLTALAVYFADASPTTLVPHRAAARIRDRHLAVAEALRGVLALVTGAVVVLIGVVWSLPFWLGTATGRSLAVLPSRSPLAGFLLVHGAFLLVLAVFLARHVLQWGRPSPRIGAVLGGLGVVAIAAGELYTVGSAVLATLLLALAWIVLRVSTYRATRDAASEAVTPEIGTSPAVSDGTPTDGAPSGSSTAGSSSVGTGARPGFETVLFVAGLGILVLVEFVYVSEQAGPGRLNTVFKTYAQVWVLFAVGIGAALAWLASRRDGGLALSTDRWRTGFKALAAVLVVSTSVYAGFALPAHVSQSTAGGFEPTLDATVYAERVHPGEAAAIDWIDDLEGQPTVLLAPGRVYSWSSAPASYTGVPTVIGWAGHERGYGRETVDERTADVEAMYTGSASTQRDLLATYDVAYVYVGPVERERYETITVDEHRALELAVEVGAVRIYRVDQSALQG